MRHRLTTLAVVFTPVLIGALYILFIAMPQYQAESRFTVQASQMNNASAPSTPGSASTSLFSTGGLGSLVNGFVDGWAVEDFLNSRDCMLQLDQKIGLRKYLAKPGLDPLHALGPNANEDQLFASYQRIVHNSYNMIEQINMLDVSAYSPHDSVIISNGLLSVVQDFVNRMNQRGIDDALKVNRQAMDTAETQDKAALAAVTQWRLEHGNVDPVADATMLMSQVGLVESNLSTAQVTLDQIKDMHNPDHPMLQPAERQVEALTARLNELRGKMSGQGNTSASQLKTYVQLSNAQTFADSNLLLARQNFHQSYITAMALQRYLSIIAAPVSEVRPSQPNPVYLLLISFAIGIALWGVQSLIQSLYRSFKHG